MPRGSYSMTISQKKYYFMFENHFQYASAWLLCFLKSDLFSKKLLKNFVGTYYQNSFMVKAVTSEYYLLYYMSSTNSHS